MDRFESTIDYIHEVYNLKYQNWISSEILKDFCVDRLVCVDEFFETYFHSGRPEIF